MSNTKKTLKEVAVFAFFLLLVTVVTVFTHWLYVWHFKIDWFYDNENMAWFRLWFCITGLVSVAVMGFLINCNYKLGRSAHSILVLLAPIVVFGVIYLFNYLFLLEMTIDSDGYNFWKKFMQLFIGYGLTIFVWVISDSLIKSPATPTKNNGSRSD